MPPVSGASRTPDAPGQWRFSADSAQAHQTRRKDMRERQRLACMPRPAPSRHTRHQHHRQPASHQDEHRRPRLIVCRHASTTGHRQSRENGGPGNGSRRQTDPRHAPTPSPGPAERHGTHQEPQERPRGPEGPAPLPSTQTHATDHARASGTASQAHAPEHQHRSTAQEATGARRTAPGPAEGPRTSQRPEAQHRPPQAQPEPPERHNGRPRPTPEPRAAPADRLQHPATRHRTRRAPPPDAPRSPEKQTGGTRNSRGARPRT